MTGLYHGEKGEIMDRDGVGETGKGPYRAILTVLELNGESLKKGASGPQQLPLILLDSLGSVTASLTS